MTTEYLGVTDVAKRLGRTPRSAALADGSPTPSTDGTPVVPVAASAEDAHARTRPNNKKSPSPSLG